MKEHVQNFIVLSIAYLVSFSLTMAIISPLQSVLLSSVPASISLLFFPHGVRMIAAHYYGWKSILYLLPSSYLMYILMTQAQGDILPPLSPLVSLLACYIGMKLVTTFANVTSKDISISTWKWLLIAGFVGSIFNGLGIGLLQGHIDLTTQMLGYAIGDVSGQFALMVALIYYFRYIQTDDVTES